MNTIFDSNSEIVICGFSGRFPKSADVGEFWENLINRVNMVSDTSDRYKADEFGIPSRLGLLVDLDKFDTDFFGIYGKEIPAIEPKLRKLVEASYEAILDAGVNPVTLRGSNTAVFVGSTDGEAVAIQKRRDTPPNPYFASGSALCMMANRLSHLLDFRGPSLTLDTGCSSGGTAIHQALLAIRAGVCEAAIVAAANTILDPMGSKYFQILGATSMDGNCKSFDASAAGFCRSEGVVSVYICKRSQAKRSYATIVHAVVNNDGYKSQGIIHPSGESQAEAIAKVYEDSGVDPLEVDYVEAHGSGTPVGDPEEVKGISLALCKGRKSALAIGSVKSNMGHAEIASGLCGLAKVLLSHNAGVIPGNLHFQTPNPEIPSLCNGGIKVVDKNQPFNAKYVGFNSMGFGGVNTHFLLKLAPRDEKYIPWNPKIPVIIACSARTQTGMDILLQKSLEQWNNRKFAGLIHEIYKNHIPGFGFRGFAMVSSLQELETFSEAVEKERRPVWFIYTGLESQWVGMERDLMKFDCFKGSIQASTDILKEYDFDLMGTLACNDAMILNNLTNVLVSINSMQIALTDLMGSLGIQPDGIIGHSNGEIAAGYADQCLTRQQSLLVALSRSRAFLETNLPPSALASIGLAWEDALKQCPKGIYSAVHEAKNKVTIVGPLDEVQNFVCKLNNQGRSAKIMNSTTFAFHSPIVKDSGILARDLYTEIIPDPKMRSSKWLSSSVPKDKYSSDLAKYCSPDYFVKNAIEPVYFYGALLEVPGRAIALEISPHCNMQSILKQSLAKNTITLGLMNCKSTNNGHYFLYSMGRCYTVGLNVDFSKIYEPVQFPVSAETPNISSLIRWNHSATHEVPHYKMERGYQKGVRIICDLNSDDGFLEGHSVGGKILYPAAGYLVLAWKVFAQQNGISFYDLPIVFDNIQFHTAAVLSRDRKTEFLINVAPSSGQFEIMESENLVCSGTISNIENSIANEMYGQEYLTKMETSGSAMSKEDFYKYIQLRGYGHSDKFQGVTKMAMNGTWAEVKWLGEWICFIDAVCQLSLLHGEDGGLQVPTRMGKLSIDPMAIRTSLSRNENVVSVFYYKDLSSIRIPGLEVRGLVTTRLQLKHEQSPLSINRQIFLPYLETPGNLVSLSEKEAIQMSLQIVFENSFEPQFNFLQLSIGRTAEVVLQIAKKEWCNKLSSNRFVVVDDASKEISSEATFHLAFVDKERNILQAKAFNSPKGFILYKGEFSVDMSGMYIIFKKIYREETHDVTTPLYLLRSACTLPSNCFVVKTDEVDFRWIRKAKQAIENLLDLERIYFASNCMVSGILGFVKCLLSEVKSGKIRCFHFQDDTNWDLRAPSEMLEDQMRKDLVFNIYKDSTWGTLCHLSIENQLRTPKFSTYGYVNTLVHGDLSSLEWIESPLKLAACDDLVEVHYTALNFKDILIASGKLSSDSSMENRPHDSYIGIEYAGVFKGKRVCGMDNGSCLATRIRPLEHLMVEIPDDWSFLDASTMYVVFATAYFGLIVKAKLTPGQSVLIHAGSGGVGQAAIELAVSMKCRVFTTVSTEEKREFLKKRFPSLTDSCFASSRDSNNFEAHVAVHTQGRGVDVVLNSLAGEKLHASIRCLAFMGKFIEIGKVDIMNDTKIGMHVYIKGISFHHVLGTLSSLPEDVMQPFNKFLEERMRSGIFRPLPTHVFKHHQVEEAFRFMAKGSHLGKVVIQIKEDECRPAYVLVQPRTYFDPTKSYIIVGGLGGMGFALADWMVQRGSKNLVLTSRTGKLSSFHDYYLVHWKNQHVRVVIATLDATTIDGAKELLECAQKLGKLGGIFNTSLVLNDAAFLNQSEETFAKVSRCKADVSINLDLLTRCLAPELEYFVVFASMASGRGNAGQTNYGHANSVMERICERRKSEGLPALAIQWGPVADVGYFHRTKTQMRSFEFAEQKISSCLETLDVLLQQNIHPVVESHVLMPMNSSSSQVPPNDVLVNSVANVLGIHDISKINKKSLLVDFGMDSIMTTEIINLLEYTIGRQFSKKEIAKFTFQDLAVLDAKC